MEENINLDKKKYFTKFHPNHNCIISVHMLPMYALPYCKTTSSKERMETLYITDLSVTRSHNFLCDRSVTKLEKYLC